MSKERMMKKLAIADRADEMGLLDFSKIILTMDLEIADKEYSLDFDSLVTANDSDFIHDILGIQNNINRQDKTINSEFLPRHSGFVAK